MTCSTYADLIAHVGHKLVCVTYADGANVAVECETCHEVVLDFDQPFDELVAVEWAVSYIVPASKVDQARAAIVEAVHGAVKLGEVNAGVKVMPAPYASWSDVPSWLTDDDEGGYEDDENAKVAQ